MGADFEVVISDHRFPDITIQERVLSKIGAHLVVGQAKTEDEIIQLAKGAHAILNARAKITEKVINALERCKVIVRYGVGVDTVDVKAATRKGIMVSNVLDYCVDEVADHAFALILCLARKIVLSARKVRKGEWNIADLRPIKRLNRQVIGVIGFGRIGRAFAKKAIPVGFKIIAYDPYLHNEGEKEDGVTFVAFESLLKQSDYITLHLPLTGETRGMIGRQQMELMKPTTFVVNVSRGHLIDEEALVQALEEKRIAGAGLDVLVEEPPKSNNPLLKMDQVIVTSHAAFYSDEAIQELQQKAAERVVTALSGGIPEPLVNPQVLK
jgi:D-3-phosphoglycerate dehydrogenase